MKLTPISVTEYPQTKNVAIYERTHQLARNLCNCETESANIWAQTQEPIIFPELMQHVTAYLTVIATMLIRTMETLHPEQFDITHHGIYFSGSLLAWKNFLFSPQAQNNLHMQLYIAPEIIRLAPEFFYPDPDEAKKYSLQQTSMERDITSRLLTVHYDEADMLRPIKNDKEPILKCLRHTLMITANAYTLYPFSRKLAQYGVATLMPTDIEGIVDGRDWDTPGSPVMPALSEPWFKENAGNYFDKDNYFDKAAEEYDRLRRGWTPEMTLASMPGLIQTRLLITATEFQWYGILSQDFLRMSPAREPMIAFYNPVLRECGYKLFELTNGRVGYGKPVMPAKR